jgi:hypothetical protein
MSVAANIETAFLEACAAVSGVAHTEAPEPGRIDVLPAVTMYFVGCPQTVSSTGYDVVEWTWQVGITVPLNELAEAQTTLQALLPSIMQIVRTSPDLGGTCDWAFLDDRSEPPARVADDKGFRKNIYLRAQTTEGP